MERIVFVYALIMMSVCRLSAKHVFISQLMKWREAQEHCKLHFTDLSPITSKLEEMVFRQFAKQSRLCGWIGLYRDSSSTNGWKWSGGDHLTYHNWISPPLDIYNYTCWRRNRWVAVGDVRRYFYCLNLIVVEVKKPWEEALEHCREKHTNFSSLLSETERLLAMSEIQHDHITDLVWMGLRYLGDSWVWVDGNPLVYKAWPQGGDVGYQCPKRNRCGALTKKGEWVNRDCQERLSFICY